MRLPVVSSPASRNRNSCCTTSSKQLSSLRSKQACKNGATFPDFEMYLCFSLRRKSMQVSLKVINLASTFFCEAERNLLPLWTLPKMVVLRAYCQFLVWANKSLESPIISSYGLLLPNFSWKKFSPKRVFTTISPPMQHPNLNSSGFSLSRSLIFSATTFSITDSLLLIIQKWNRFEMILLDFFHSSPSENISPFSTSLQKIKNFFFGSLLLNSVAILLTIYGSTTRIWSTPRVSMTINLICGFLVTISWQKRCELPSIALLSLLRVAKVVNGLQMSATLSNPSAIPALRQTTSCASSSVQIAQEMSSTSIIQGS